MAKKKIPIKIKKNILGYIKELKKDGLPIQKVFLYGSYAKGNSHKWSDIDICVISSAFTFKKKNTLGYLWTKRRIEDIKAMIAPVGFHPKNFINENPLVWEIKKTGKIIYQE